MEFKIFAKKEQKSEQESNCRSRSGVGIQNLYSELSDSKGDQQQEQERSQTGV